MHLVSGHCKSSEKQPALFLLHCVGNRAPGAAERRKSVCSLVRNSIVHIKSFLEVGGQSRTASLYGSFILSLDKSQFWSQPLPGSACPVSMFKWAKQHLSRSFTPRVCSDVCWCPGKGFFWAEEAARWWQPSEFGVPLDTPHHPQEQQHCMVPLPLSITVRCKGTQGKTKAVAMLCCSLCLEPCRCLDFLHLWENRRVQGASWRRTCPSCMQRCTQSRC